MASRRQYTAAFKREAVRLAHERGNKSAVARELDIHVSLLRRWTQELEDSGEKAFPGQGNARDEELARLHRELKRAQEEDAIRRAISPR